MNLIQVREGGKDVWYDLDKAYCIVPDGYMTMVYFINGDIRYVDGLLSHDGEGWTFLQR